MKTKIIVITGGVYSSLGKGIIASSIGCILRHGNYNISMLKLDPYLNTDPGLLNPMQHGEVFITEDGQRADLDLGHYERFTQTNMNKTATQTGGRLYVEIFEDERKNKYNGATIQIVPHLTNKIAEKINQAIKFNNPDFLIIEIGGTVGDIESLSFIEALRLYNVKYKNVMFIHCSPLFKIPSNDEIKTKPTQHSIKTLRNLGINPSILVLRYNEMISKNDKEKISLTCDININNIFISKECKYLYEVPKILFDQGIHKSIIKYFNLKHSKFNMNNWNKFLDSIYVKKDKKVKICICGKYCELNDSYLSLIESLKITSYKLKIESEIELIDVSKINKNNISKYDLFIIPDGEYSKIDFKYFNIIINYCYKNNLPFLGIKLGMQALIEYFINQMDYNNNIGYYSGSKEIKIINNTLAKNIYKLNSIKERHWNNWSINVKHIKCNEVVISGISDIGVEIIEIKNKKMIGVLFHPEYVSKPNEPHVLFEYLLRSIKK